ncbi:hypothetical protein [Gimesia aquarii]|uniref:Uncharacterized protein n=1 Tax=Gimesia aquarii TaxID=2527964 RepID=A0A517X0M5_9PLAN|nr:hypothetical protein [Gimesia aquarii]QDU11051.1 hypothetical protein V202x_44670 [Gimesia aquarii]
MTSDNGRPTPLNSILDQISNDPVPAHVESRLRPQFDVLRRRLSSQPDVTSPSVIPANWSRLPVLVSGIVVASLLIVSLFFTLGNKDAWAQVVKAVQAKPWMRGIIKDSQGQKRVELWFSPNSDVVALKSGQTARYADLRKQHTYEYKPKENLIYLVGTRKDDRERLAFQNTLFQAFSHLNQQIVQPKSQIKIVKQSQQEVQEGNHRWIDYRFEINDPARTPNEYRVTFRVDAKSSLPRSMEEEFFVEGKNRIRKIEFDYPNTGPADIYALGVPRTAKLVDRLPSGNLVKILTNVEEMRRRPMESYSAVVLQSITRNNGQRQLVNAYRVLRNGLDLEIKQVDPEELLAFQMKVYSTKHIDPPDDVDLTLWWKEQVANLTFSDVPTSDSTLESLVASYKYILPEFAGYPAMGGEPNANRKVSVTNGSDLVTVRVQTNYETPVEYAYWIDRTRGHTVIRSEQEDTANKEQNGWIHTTVIDKLKKSPKGRWYATQARRGMVENTGDELSDGIGVAPVSTTTSHYFVEFQDDPDAK